MNVNNSHSREAREFSLAVSHCHSLALHDLLSERCRLALDVECGNGDSTRVVSRVADRIIGIDRSKAAYMRTNKMNLGEKFEFRHVDFFKYEPPELFDLISTAWFVNFLESEHEVRRFMRKVVHLLRPDGYLCLVLAIHGGRKTGENEDRNSKDRSFKFGSAQSVARYWEVLPLMRILRERFELNTWDVKGTLANEFRLERLETEPSFEILTGRLRKVWRTNG